MENLLRMVNNNPLQGGVPIEKFPHNELFITRPKENLKLAGQQPLRPGVGHAFPKVFIDVLNLNGFAFRVFG